MKRIVRYWLLSLLLLPALSQGMSAQELQQALQAGEELTLIDVRSRTDYRRGHIPGAINIQAILMPRKPLPPLGRVVVYGDGVDTEATRQALAALNTKPGIEAEMLVGGYAAWESGNRANTRGRGMRRAQIRQLSYDDLQRVVDGNEEVVLVDLRRGDDDGEVLSDLRDQFPQTRIVRPRLRDVQPRPGSARARQKDRQVLSVRALTGRGIDASRLYVLVGDGDGRAERFARRLQAAGMKRVAVLIGGERILRRGGETGLRTEVVGEQP